MAGMFDDLIPNSGGQASAPALPGDDLEARPIRLTIPRAPVEGNGTQQAKQAAPVQAEGTGLSDRDRRILIRTILGEAAGEGDDGQRAVASVILNRLRSGQFGGSVPAVVTAKGQFEPWMTDQGRKRMLGYSEQGPEYTRAAANLDAILTGKVTDPTNGATHFYAPKAQAALGRKPPSWADGQEPVVVGGHNFYSPGAKQTPKGVQVASSDQNFVPAGAADSGGMFADLVPQASFGERFSGEGFGAPAEKAPELAKALREKADTEAIGPSTPGQQFNTANAEFLNTLLLNAPRNLKAALWSHIKGRPFEEVYDEIKNREEAASRQNPASSAAGKVAGVVGGIVATPELKVLEAATVGGRALKSAAVGAGLGGLGELLDSKDPVKASIAAALGGALGGVAAPVAEKIVGLVSKLVASGKSAMTFLKPDGTLTDDALAAAKEAGIDPAVLTKVMQAKYAETFAKKGASAPTAREAAADEFGIKLTPGEATNDYGKIAAEQGMARDARGPIAGKAARDFYDTREGQVTRAKAGIQERTAGQQPLVDNVNDASNQVGAAVRSKAGSAKAEYQAAYDRALNKEGEFSDIAFADIGERIRRDSLKAKEPVIIDDVTTPIAARAIQHLDATIGKVKIQDRAQPRSMEPRTAGEYKFPGEPERVGGATLPPDELVGVNMKGVDQARKQLVAFYKAAKSSSNDSDIRAMRRILAGFDDELETAINVGLFKGDDAALPALKEARRLFANYQKTFRSQGAGDSVGRAMEKIVSRDATGGEISNLLMGKAAIGEKGDSVRLAKRLKTVLDAQDFSAIQQGVWMRLTSQPEGVKDFGPQALGTRIFKFIRGDGADMAKELYSPKQLGEMLRFATVLKTITPPPGTINTSNTYYALAREIGIGSALGGAGYFLTNDPETAGALAGLKIGGKILREGYRGAAARRYFRSGAPKEVRPFTASRSTGVAAGQVAAQAQ